MNVLLIGSGGREHALAVALANSCDLTTLYCAPGNGGIEAIAQCVDLECADHAAVIAFCRDKEIGLVVIGPEIPLVTGLVDDLSAVGIKAFGPSKAAAQLEGSKSFTKDLCRRFRIPTAAAGCFGNRFAAKAYIRKVGTPIVIKADGLAAGKGVIMAQTMDDALEAVDACFKGAFGDGGNAVVIEEWLQGREASFFALVDGKTAVPLLTAQDYKRALDGDEGPNTGGMGALAPASCMTPDMIKATMSEIIEPTVAKMAAMGMPFKGVLYAGLMITDAGPKLIEYNVRFGDPECQVLMSLLKSDLLPALLATVDGTLDDITLEWHDGAALTVVMATSGYPGAYETGSEIKGLNAAVDVEDVEIFHAGTKLRKGSASATTPAGDTASDTAVATGGRVLNITARGQSIKAARDRAYQAVAEIHWPQGCYRKDIGS